MSSGPLPPRRPVDLVTAAMSRGLRLTPRRNAIIIDRAVPVPMRDGTILLADHYAPVTREPRPTVLMRGPVEVAGVPVAELYVSSDNPYCDVFIRLCDVDERGRSRNLTDQIVRCLPTQVIPGVIRRISLPLTDISHVFMAGHRIRLQVSGGAHPRFARNLGTDADQLNGTLTAPATHEIQHGARYPSALILPVAAQREGAPGPAPRGAAVDASKR